MGGRHKPPPVPRGLRFRCLSTGIRVIAYSVSRRIPEGGSTLPHGSDDSHVSLHLLDHRIQPAAQHLLGETEGEPLDGVER
jgi:hypothetical protein